MQAQCRCLGCYTECSTTQHVQAPLPCATQVLGLKGLGYEDSAAGATQHTQQDAALTFPGEVDRIYSSIPGDIVVCYQYYAAGGTRQTTLCIHNPLYLPQLVDPGAKRRIVLSLEGFVDAVLWNPGEAKAAALADMGPGEYKQMVCIEAAVATSGPIEVAPDTTWTGVQRLRMQRLE